eukprot:TRINITY_DN2544_c1_g1_i1.p1 TRINITY_DN2544_c1_g1~~TRINITY_DN2544_c1_g1_i1.p1  ORF type:complete len:348 (-),score=71.12 TRINITY_DN2544_c1_g1_i1:32-1075(-)
MYHQTRRYRNHHLLSTSFSQFSVKMRTGRHKNSRTRVMHNQPKTKTSEDKQREKLEASRKRAVEYLDIRKQALEMRDKNEFSEEALKVTQRVLNMTSECYTIWNYRKKIIVQLEEISPSTRGQLHEGELSWTQQLLAAHHKSYNVWYHRQWITKRMENMDWAREIKLCNAALDRDQRNFHCWSYRRYVANTFSVPVEDELRFTMSKIEQNFSNYSAWHQRSLLLQKIYASDPHSLLAVLGEELELVQNAFYTSPEDQSAWFYHRWLVGMCKKYNDAEKFRSIVEEELEKVTELAEEEPNSKWPLLTTVFLLQELNTEKDELIQKIDKLKAIDPTHQNYYEYLRTKAN